MKAKTAAIIFGLAFVAVGLLGYVSNPIVGASEDAIFHTDRVHNIVHLVSGALFLLVAIAAPASASGFLKIFGLVYLLLGVYGLITMGSEETAKLLGFLHVNKADNYLHIGLGLIILLAGTFSSRRAKPA
ncbi:MAG TPA: DUF4383 domain-containing protein [Chitinophagaceae bacterium]|nr:DUF4383 domain-containing protein [Chitinophagaceae bacterium]